MNGHEELVNILLKARANVSLQNSDGYTALHLAAIGGYDKIVTILLNAQANIASQSKYGETALHLAARGGHEKVVKILLKAHGDVFKKDRFGTTARDLARKYKHENVAQILLWAEMETEEFSDLGCDVVPKKTFYENYQTWERILARSGRSKQDYADPGSDRASTYTGILFI